MSQQRSLPFDRTELLDSLWTGLPAQVREQVVVLYAGLIARSTRGKVGAPSQPVAAVSPRLVGQAPTRVDGVLEREVLAKGSSEPRLDSPGMAITAPASTEPNGTTIRNIEGYTAL